MLDYLQLTFAEPNFANVYHHNLHVFSRRGFLGILLLPTAVVFVPTASSSSIPNPLPRALVFDLAGPLWMPPLGHLRGGGGAPFTLNENGNLKEIKPSHRDTFMDCFLPFLPKNPKRDSHSLDSHCMRPFEMV